MADEVPVEETPPEETPPEETPAEETLPVVEETPEAPDGGTDVADAMDELLEDDADDLDAEPVEEKAPVETPPEGQEKPKEGEEPPAEAPPTEPQSPPAVPKPEATPKPEEVPPPEQAPAATPAETPPAATAPETPPPSMEDIRAQYQESRNELEQNVAKEHYKLSEEQVKRMDDGDPAVVSELLAKTYMDAVTGSVAHMITHLPTLIENVLLSRDTNADFEKQFYDAHPQLNSSEHGDTVGKFGQAYRTVNPQATAEEFIRDVGATALVALGIPPTSIGEVPPAGAAETPSEPAPKPFQPAGTGSGSAAPTISTNPYEQLSEEMAADDLDLG